MERGAGGNKAKRLDRKHQPAQSGEAMAAVKYRTREEMEAGLENIRQSPKDIGVLKLISRRPQTDEPRSARLKAQLDPAHGLVGDNWKARGSRGTPDGSANPEMQLNVMNARVIELLAPERSSLGAGGRPVVR